MPAGGARPGAGRKSKADELNLREKLAPMEAPALEALSKGIAKGDMSFIKLYFEYYFGKPTESIAIDHSGEIDTKTSLDVSKLSDTAIRELLNARRGKDS